MAGPLYGSGFVDLKPQLSQGFASSLGGQLKTAGKAIAGLAAVKGISEAFSSSVQSAISFESAFAGVTKTVNGTTEQIAGLREGILEMAKTIPASREDIAGVAEAAGQLGVETDNILEFTRVMVDLGNSTNLSADQAATSLARFANITQLPQSEFDKLGSTVVALGNNLATTEAEIVEFGLRLAGAGSQIGLSEDQILGMAGALSSVGIAADAGGTAFSRVFVELANSVDSGNEKLGQFAEVAGLSVGQFSNLFKTDAAGAVVTFVEGLDRIADSGGNVFGVLDQLGLADIRVRDALLRSAGAGDLLRESLELGADAWVENNALTKEAAQRYQTTESQLEIMKNRLSDVGREFGETLLPTIVDTTESFVDLADSLKPVLDVVGNIFAGLNLFAGSKETREFKDAVIGLGKDIEERAIPPMDALANRVADLGRTGIDVTAGQFQRLAREASVTGPELGAVANAMIAYSQAGIDVGFTTAELVDLFSQVPGAAEATRSSFEGLNPELLKIAGFGGEAAGSIEGVDEAGEGLDLSEPAEEAKDLAGQFAEAAIQGESLRGLIVELTSPVFAAVSSFEDYKDAVEDAKEAQEEHGKNSDEFRLAQLAIGEAVLKLGADFDNAGEDIDVALDAISTAMGVTKDELIGILQSLGISVDTESGKIGSSIVDGVLDPLDLLGQELVFKAGTEISELGDKTAQSAGQQASPIGTAIVEGILGPIGSLSDKLVQKTSQEITSSISGIKGAIKARSPSKLFYDEIGVPIGEGITLGAVDTTGALSAQLSSSLAGVASSLDVPSVPNVQGSFTTNSDTDFGDGNGSNGDINITVNNPTGEPTEESLQTAALAVAVSGYVNR